MKAQLINWPWSFRLRGRKRVVLTRVGRKLATRLRKRLRRRRTDNGTIPRGLRLRKTGELINSIRYEAGTRTIAPRGSRGRISNLSLMRVHIKRLSINPMGLRTEAKAIKKLVREEVRKEMRVKK